MASISCAAPFAASMMWRPQHDITSPCTSAPPLRPLRACGKRIGAHCIWGGLRMTDARTITLALDGDWRGHHGNAPCPVCQPERRRDQRALSLSGANGKLLMHCHKSGCGFHDILRAAGLPPEHLAPDTTARREAETKLAEYERAKLDKARAIWCRSSPISGTPGEAYLRGRGITCNLPPSLRWASDLHHGPSGRWLSAMVAEVSTGAVHRTFFENGGQRISGCAKMMLGPCSGGAVRLSEGKRGRLSCVRA